MYWSLWDHPRLCGEYSAILSRSPWIVGSPPLTRGILFDTFLTCCLSRDHPRLRGEYEGELEDLVDEQGSPPLTRGILCLVTGLKVALRITPAYAGNTRRRECQRVMWWDHPRLRGEYRCREKVTLTQEGSPPLTRGIPISGDCLSVRVGITPAYAGNTTTYGFLEIVAEDHPRLRGEYCQTSAHQRFLAGSPPLTRGILKIKPI